MPKKKTGRFSEYLKNQVIATQDSIAKLAEPGYRGIPAPKNTSEFISQETLARRDAGEPMSRADSTQLGYPLGVLSKPETAFNPAKDPLPLEYREHKPTFGKGKVEYQVKDSDGSWQTVPKDWWEAQKKSDETQSEQRRKYLNKPTQSANPGAGKPKLEF